MRIVLDLQGAQSSSSRNRGIGRYSLSLTKAIVANRGEHEIIIALNALFPEATDALYDEFSTLLPPKNIAVWHVPEPVRYVDRANDSRRETAEKTREAFLVSLNPDIILITSLFEGFEDDAVTSISSLTHTPTAIILYDLIPLIYDSIYLENPDLKEWYLGKIKSLKQADLLLSISHSAKNEAHKYLAIPEERMVNISTAADTHFHPRTIKLGEEAEVREKYGITKSFVMYTGGMDHRKNIEGLIRAYALLPTDLREKYQLAIVCSIRDEDKARLITLAKSQNLHEEELVFTGFVPDGDLVALYNLCSLFVFPSWHEGFGLPALEAMLCGRVVIGSNTSSLPEVIGLEEALFDPRDDRSIAEKLKQALTDKHFRKRLKAHGLKQAKLFSWGASARKALDTLVEYCNTLKHAEEKVKESIKPDILPALIQSLAPQVESWGEDELLLLSADIAQNFPPLPRIKQILLDISPLIHKNTVQKSHKRLLALLHRALAEPPTGYCTEPIYRETLQSPYLYAGNLAAELFNTESETLKDGTIDAWQGDIFVGSDIGESVSPDYPSILKEMRHNRVIVAFILYDSTPFFSIGEMTSSTREHYLAQLNLIASLDALLTLNSADAERVKKGLLKEKIETRCRIDDRDVGEAGTALALLSRYLRQVDLGEKIAWRVEGPFDSSYSLALVNRETALALDALGHDVILHSTEGTGDFDPREDFLVNEPEIERLYRKSIGHSEEEADVCSRDLYPPRVNDMKAPINMLHNYAWEESAFPQKWVDNFNQHLTGLTSLSSYVQKVMIDNGVKVPIATSGCGVDHWERITADEKYRLQDQHAFRFLHVSSCFPRKGADVLLKAYGEEFDNDDDIVLIIKTFPNPHNEIHTWLKEAKEINGKFPDVMIIEEDLPASQLKALYQQCHALVGPSRAEGFGLPFAEAMLSELPVITTNWSGQLDFCSDETAWLVDYAFTPAKTHFELFDSVWAEPSVEHLRERMREVYVLPADKRIAKSKKARDLLLERFCWSDVAARLVDAARSFSTIDQPVKPKIGWITTWNTKCGIAAYSEHLIDMMHQDVTILAARAKDRTAPDTAQVHRCWDATGEDQLIELEETIERLDLDTIVLQFNYGFFNFYHLYDFLIKQYQKKRTMVIMMHATTDPAHILFKHLEILLPAFEYTTRILVHSVTDLNHLKTHGLVDNVTLFPHGIPDWAEKTDEAANSSFLLGSYGFFLPHKGLLELIDTMKILVERGIDIRLKMLNAEYPVPVSRELVKDASEKIEALGLTQQIELMTDFQPNEASLTALSSCDLLLFPYQETGESSSAAVRYGLASGTPVAVTPLEIFEDVDQTVYKLSGYAPKEMAESIMHLISDIKNNSEVFQKKNADAKKWRDSHHYSELGKRLGNILEALANQRNKDK